ncbi:transglycosylase domain-containing protein [Bacillus testis]|uniref:transglycosylase domain-containing protein n=1 Tax=Bacillus testis TaxID=1622072 RepID=UPI00067E7959|nr:transglycosylase domain-containing protein [Bacillus testis]
MEATTRTRNRKSAKIARALTFILLIGGGALLAIYLFLLIYAKVSGAPPLAVTQSTLFYSDNGKVIGEYNNGQKRYWVTLDDISPALIQAVVSVEDKSFYRHNGFDYKRIAGAILADAKALEKVQGASTITQQYARNLYLSHTKSWNRKMNEAFYTMRLEMNYSKDEILEGYLNTIYFGHGAYGVEAASRFYFGKPAKALSLNEAAMLAGIPKGPSYYSPIRSMEHARQRQAVVLAAMEKSGYITGVDASKAKSMPVSLNGSYEQYEAMAPYYISAVKQALKSEIHLDEKTLALGGLKVYTSLNIKQQQAAEEAFLHTLSQQSDIQGALVAMNPKNGEVKALVGGKNYEDSPFNRAIQAVRQPGSTIKPLLYYAALEHGFTPATMLRSESTTFTFDDGRSSYAPHNYNSQYAGKDITLSQALALSDNIYAVKTHLFLGEKQLVKTAKQFGIESKIEAVPSAALGTSGVKVIEMVNAYSHLANGGKEVSPVFIKKVENSLGEVIYKAPEFHKQVLDYKKAFVMTSMMTGIFNKKWNGYADVTGTTLIPRLSRQYAGKSGTTSTDSWMIGYTPQLVTGVWIGYDQAKIIDNPSERGYAKNIWADFMEDSLAKSAFKTFKPHGKQLVAVKINPDSGKLATKHCPDSVLTYFVKGTEPKDYCKLHVNDNAEASPHPQDKKLDKPWYKKLVPFF